MSLNWSDWAMRIQTTTLTEMRKWGCKIPAIGCVSADEETVFSQITCNSGINLESGIGSSSLELLSLPSTLLSPASNSRSGEHIRLPFALNLRKCLPSHVYFPELFGVHMRVGLAKIWTHPSPPPYQSVEATQRRISTWTASETH